MSLLSPVSCRALERTRICGRSRWNRAGEVPFSGNFGKGVIKEAHGTLPYCENWREFSQERMNSLWSGARLASSSRSSVFVPTDPALPGQASTRSFFFVRPSGKVGKSCGLSVWSRLWKPRESSVRRSWRRALTSRPPFYYRNLGIFVHPEGNKNGCLGTGEIPGHPGAIVAGSAYPILKNWN